MQCIADRSRRIGTCPHGPPGRIADDGIHATPTYPCFLGMLASDTEGVAVPWSPSTILRYADRSPRQEMINYATTETRSARSTRIFTTGRTSAPASTRLSIGCSSMTSPSCGVAKHNCHVLGKKITKLVMAHFCWRVTTAPGPSATGFDPAVTSRKPGAPRRPSGPAPSGPPGADRGPGAGTSDHGACSPGGDGGRTEHRQDAAAMVEHYGLPVPRGRPDASASTGPRGGCRRRRAGRPGWGDVGHARKTVSTRRIW
jgi:hypothetical protein